MPENVSVSYTIIIAYSREAYDRKNSLCVTDASHVPDNLNVNSDPSPTLK